MPVLVTESKTVEKPLIKYAQKAGWGYIPPTEALNLRRGESGKLFYKVLKDSLIKLNPDFLNEDSASEVIQKLDNTQDTNTGNKGNFNWARGHKAIFDKTKDLSLQLSEVFNKFSNFQNSTENF